AGGARALSGPLADESARARLGEGARRAPPARARRRRAQGPPWSGRPGPTARHQEERDARPAEDRSPVRRLLHGADAPRASDLRVAGADRDPVGPEVSEWHAD